VPGESAASSTDDDAPTKAVSTSDITGLQINTPSIGLHTTSTAPSAHPQRDTWTGVSQVEGARVERGGGALTWRIEAASLYPALRPRHPAAHPEHSALRKSAQCPPTVSRWRWREPTLIELHWRPIAVNDTYREPRDPSRRCRPSSPPLETPSRSRSRPPLLPSPPTPEHSAVWSPAIASTLATPPMSPMSPTPQTNWPWSAAVGARQPLRVHRLAHRYTLAQHSGQLLWPRAWPPLSGFEYQHISGLLRATRASAVSERVTYTSL